jgi:DNA-directed RNA polymerase subunit RPC12/RpoP
MEKYYKVSDVGAVIEKLLKTPYYQLEGESWYSGVSAVWDALLTTPSIEADIDELKNEVIDLNNRRHLIWALGVDYDGCNTVKSLKELIDELVSYTQLPREQVPDITSRIGKWIRVDNHRWKCTACGKETDLPHYDGAYYCFNCGAKMKEDNEDE